MDMLHLDKLIEFLKEHYASTKRKLDLVLEQEEITFELLPFFFPPKSLVLMIHPSSEQPTCFGDAILLAYPQAGTPQAEGLAAYSSCLAIIAFSTSASLWGSLISVTAWLFDERL